MFWLKACPKCHGDLHMESDTYGPYIACLQCSRYLTNDEEARLKLSIPVAGVRPCLIAQMEGAAA